MDEQEETKAAREELELTLKAAEQLVREDLESFWDFDDEDSDEEESHEVTDEEVLDTLKSALSVNDGEGCLSIELENAKDCEDGRDGGAMVYTETYLWVGDFKKNPEYVALLDHYDLDGKVKRTEDVEECGCEACGRKGDEMLDRLEEIKRELKTK